MFTGHRCDTARGGFPGSHRDRLGLQNATDICTALMITKQGELPPCNYCWNTHNWTVTWKLTRRLAGHSGPETEMMVKSPTILLMVLVQWQHTVWASCWHVFSVLQRTLSIPHRKEADTFSEITTYTNLEWKQGPQAHLFFFKYWQFFPLFFPAGGSLLYVAQGTFNNHTRQLEIWFIFPN